MLAVSGRAATRQVCEVDIVTGQTINSPASSIIREMVSEQGKINPWPYYARLHELGEVFEMPDGSFFVAGYNAVAEGLRSSAFGKGQGQARDPAFSVLTPEQREDLREIESDSSLNFVAMDGAPHARIRGIVQGKFTPRNVRSVEASIPVVIDRLLDTIDPTRPVDIMGEFSALFAPEIMAELIGLPNDRREKVVELAGVGLKSIDPGSTFEQRREGARAGRKLRDYIREVMADRRTNPREDLVSDITSDTQLTEPEKARLLQTLYLGGYGTTAHMVGNGLYLLLKNPDQFALLKQDGSLAKAAVEEILRMDGAISLTAMVALEDAELEGVKIAKGRGVTLLLAAANRDPDIYPDPDRFDILRKNKPHLSFAGGAHYCLGVNLARLELELVIRRLVERFPNMVLAEDPPPRTPTFHQQSWDHVMVLLEPKS